MQWFTSDNDKFNNFDECSGRGLENWMQFSCESSETMNLQTQMDINHALSCLVMWRIYDMQNVYRDGWFEFTQF